MRAFFKQSVLLGHFIDVATTLKKGIRKPKTKPKTAREKKNQNKQGRGRGGLILQGNEIEDTKNKH